jgi:hypothetical protein
VKLYAQVVPKGEPAQGTVWTAPDGVQYAIWTNAFDCSPGRALVGVIPASSLPNLMAFENKAAMVDWIVQDVMSREGWVH